MPRHAALLLCTALVAWSGTASAETASCTRDWVKRDPSATLEACTSILRSALADQEKADALKIRARAALRLKRLDIAVPDLELALNLAPKDPAAHIWRGWAHFEQGEYEEALKRTSAARALDPKDTDPHILAASVAVRLGQYGRASSIYADAVGLQPSNVLIRYRYSKLLSHMQDYPAALVQLDALLALPRADTTRSADLMIYSRSVTYRTAAQLLRASLLMDLARRDEADGTFEQILNEDPSSFTYAMRAAHRFKANETEAVIQADVDKAIELDPDYWLAREMQARIHFFARRYAAAEAEYARAIELKPDYGKLRWWRAMALRRIDRLDEATDEALTAWAVDPGYVTSEKVEVLSQRGYLQLSRNRDANLSIADAIRACMLDEKCF